MTQAAHAEHVAPVIDMFAHVTPEERAVIEARRGQHNPRPHGWHDLHYISITDKLDAIRIYARQGLHPILIHGVRDGRCTCGRHPCAAIGKHPVHAGWQRAALDLDALDRDLRDSHYSIGLRTGRQPSGLVLVCIDCDGERSLLEPLEAKFGKLPPTLTASSGKGLHLIYRFEGKGPPKNRVRLSAGVDVRSEGGQIVAAPSLHASGRRYRWIDIREPAVLP
ncbi:MAG TPA: bifunctional DNA primase/polymerase [Jiangellaceae bacterium]|nr:bifunctional DNA primase/polymerase [Jiangellaceae bacterium]